MNTSLLQKQSHGGDFYHWNKQMGIAQQDILDFSVNVRPEGMPDFLKAGLLKTLNGLSAYPSPHAEELQELCAEYYGLAPQNFVFGNGSNELFTALASALKKRGISRAYIFEPAFSEYRFSLEKAGISAESVPCPLIPLDKAEIQNPAFCMNAETILQNRETVLESIEKSLETFCADSVIFLANPANPSGFFITREKLLPLIDKRKDCLFVIDEAFIEYTGEKSLIFSLPDNAVIVRSLTKFYAAAGVRLGYIACGRNLAEEIQNLLPTWNVNSFAVALGKILFTHHETVNKDAETARRLNNGRKTDLYKKLAEIQGIALYPSCSNYILFSLKNAPCDFWQNLLAKHHISLRNCANYAGLEQGSFFRAAVRFPEDHDKLCNAIKDLLAQPAPAEMPKKKPALMLLGTSSNAGKSILTAAFCRIFTQDGYTVRPFKAQNMSLNSGVTLLGDEMGRAQIVQARACNTEPDCKMNPILLKPQTDTGSQIIVRGKPIGTAHAREYYQKKQELWEIVTKTYDELAEEADIMVLEGAGSPAEINIKENDIVNIKMAEYAKASTLLVGDIDRGGIYASFLGTWQTFTPQEEKLLTGFLVNRFRGDATLLAPAHDYLEELTGKKVLGVIPYIKDMNLPEEDMAGALWNTAANRHEKLDYGNKDRKLDIALVMLGKISNHTDFEPLALEEHCLVRPVYSAAELGTPDLIILPGSKSVVADLEELNQKGLAEKIKSCAKDTFILGVCGGLQMLGKEILDPDQIETSQVKTQGLDLLPISSTFYKEKQLTVVENIESPLGACIYGYEIHHGLSKTLDNTETQGYFKDKDGNIYGFAQNNIWATYVHGLFDDDAFRLQFINHVRNFRGLNPAASCTPYALDASLNRLADIVRNNVDMQAIYESLGISR